MNILVVCTGNICRSPMAEYILKKELTGKTKSSVAVSSAGTYALTGNAAAPEAGYAVRSLFDVIIDPHKARQLDDKLIEDADVILAMEKYHRQWIIKHAPKAGSKTFLLGTYHQTEPVENIFDPYGQSVDRYLTCANLIHACIQGWIDTIFDS